MNSWRGSKGALVMRLGTREVGCFFLRMATPLSGGLARIFAFNDLKSEGLFGFADVTLAGKVFPASCQIIR